MASYPRSGAEVGSHILQSIHDPQLLQDVLQFLENFRLNIPNEQYTRRRIRKLRLHFLRKINRKIRTSDKPLFEEYKDLHDRGGINKNVHKMSEKQLYPCK